MYDYNLREAVDKVLTMIHHDFKDKVGLAIYIVSEEYNVSTTAISHQLHRIKNLKNRKKLELLNNKQYDRVYRG
jgi:hypothetical protein